MGVERMESHEIQKAQAKAGNPAQSPTGAGQAVRGGKEGRGARAKSREAEGLELYRIYKMPESMITSEIYAKIELINRGLNRMLAYIREGLGEFNDAEHVRSMITSIREEARQLLKEQERLEALTRFKLIKTIERTYNVTIEDIAGRKVNHVVYRAVEEMKGADILTELEFMRDALRFTASRRIRSAPSYLDRESRINLDKNMLKAVEKGVNYMLGSVDKLKKLLDKLPGYDAKLDHPEQESQKLISAEDQLFDPEFSLWVLPMDTPTHKIIRMHVFVGNTNAKGTVVLSYKPPKGDWTPLENLYIPSVVNIHLSYFSYDRYVDIPWSEPGTYIFRGEFKGEQQWKSVTKDEKVEVKPVTPSSTPI